MPAGAAVAAGEQDPHGLQLECHQSVTRVTTETLQAQSEDGSIPAHLPDPSSRQLSSSQGMIPIFQQL